MELKGGLKKIYRSRDLCLLDPGVEESLPGRIFVSQGRAFLHVKLPNAVLGVHNSLLVDHINGNPLDNRKSNLRVATISQNNANARKTTKRKTSSKYRGVVKSTYSTVWYSQINCNKKRYFLGTFKHEDEAARAYDKKAKELFGEFACLNFNDEKAG